MDRLEDEGFEVDVDRQPDLAPVGEVIAQDPAGGTEADEGSTVKLVVSTGPGDVTVPTVEGFTEERAIRELNRAGCGQREDTNLCGFKVEVRQEASDSDRRGRCDQDQPARWQRPLRSGSRVLLFVSTGPKQVEVPDVVGLARESAEATLNRAGLGFTITRGGVGPGPGHGDRAGSGRAAPSWTRARASRSPSPRSRRPLRSRTSSASRATAPRTPSGTSGCGRWSSSEETDDPDEVDQVLRQSPGPGADVDPRSEVEIVVGVAPEEDDEGDELVPDGTGEGLLVE